MANGSGTGRGMDRRTFVKGCVTASIAGTALAAGYSMANPLSLGGGATKTVHYFGTKKVGGPAPRGIPTLPLTFASDGSISGSPTLAGQNILDWYHYCGHSQAPGLQTTYTGDEKLYYFVSKDKIATGYDPWYRDHIPAEGGFGDPVNVKDFASYANASTKDDVHGAAVAWRSKGQSGKNIVTGVLLRIPDSMKALVAYEGADPTLVGQAGLADGFLAFVTFCTHFCCVPGWHEADLAKAQGAWDDIFCTCHGSQYDPFTLKSYSYQMETEHKVSPLDPNYKGS